MRKKKKKKRERERERNDNFYSFFNDLVSNVHLLKFLVKAAESSF
jgi:hypothetical protein